MHAPVSTFHNLIASLPLRNSFNISHRWGASGSLNTGLTTRNCQGNGVVAGTQTLIAQLIPIGALESL